MINSNIALFFVTTFPALLYLLIIITIIPRKTVSKRKVVTGLMAGSISTFFVTSMHFMFPNYITPICNTFSINIIFLSFIQIALTEEASKFLTYKMTNLGKTHLSPFAVMVYCMLPSVSFAILENIQYLNNFPSGGFELAIKRNITATLMHVICGAIIGYYVAIGTFVKPRINNWINKRKKTRIAVYSAIGVFFATLLHGLYDLNLFLQAFSKHYTKSQSNTYSFAIIAMGLIILRQIIHKLKKVKY